MSGLMGAGVICGIFCGLSISFYFISAEVLKQNSLGNYKGDRFDYIAEWDVLQEEDNVSANFNTEYTRKDWQAEQFAKGNIKM